MAITGGLMLWYAGTVNQEAFTKEPPTHTRDLYAREIARKGNVVMVSKALVDAVKRDNTLVLTGVAIRQRMNKDGGLEACELVEIDSGSPAARVGLRPGDRLMRVNGYPIRELQARRTDLEGSRCWKLDVLRRGKPLSIMIEMR